MAERRSDQQIAEDAADQAYARLTAANARKTRTADEAAKAATAATRAQAKFEHAVTDIDVSDDYRERLAERMEAESAPAAPAETPTGVVTTEAGGPSAVAKSGREDYVDGLPETDAPRDELAERIHQAALAPPARELGTPEDEGRPAVLEGTADDEPESSVPGEEPLVP